MVMVEERLMKAEEAVDAALEAARKVVEELEEARRQLTTSYYATKEIRPK